MTIQRSPSLLFAGLWAGWLVAVYVALAHPERTTLGLVVLLAFFAIEVPATIIVMPGNARDTLSEIMTWVVRHMSKHRQPRGWNLALLAAVLLPVSWLLKRQIAYHSESEVLADLMALAVCVWLWDHFVNPDVHG